MVRYELDFTVPSPGEHVSFMEFSPNGRFLAVGDRVSSVLYILDNLAGFRPTISVATLAKPTALVWETSKSFYVGSSDGRFTHYQIDVGGGKLVPGAVNSLFYGQFPITAIALNAESKTLVLSVGPHVFMFRRIRVTNEFRFIDKISNRLNFERDPGSPAPPFPRSICFAPNNVLVITFCRRNIASIVLEFDGGSRSHTLSQTTRIDYSGLPLLKAITSASDDEIHQFNRLWVHGGVSQADSDDVHFLFINEGAATLSGSALGGTIIRDAITQREVQLLEHTSTANRHISVMAYHVSNGKYSIATVSRGAGATVKIWTAQRPSRALGQSRRGFLTLQRCAIVALLITLLVAMLKVVEQRPSVAMLSVVEKRPNVDKIAQFCFRTALTFVKMCIKVGYTILSAAEGAVLEAGDTWD